MYGITLYIIRNYKYAHIARKCRHLRRSGQFCFPRAAPQPVQGLCRRNHHTPIRSITIEMRGNGFPGPRAAPNGNRYNWKSRLYQISSDFHSENNDTDGPCNNTCSTRCLVLYKDYWYHCFRTQAALSLRCP